MPDTPTESVTIEDLASLVARARRADADAAKWFARIDELEKSRHQESPLDAAYERVRLAVAARAKELAVVEQKDAWNEYHAAAILMADALINSPLPHSDKRLVEILANDFDPLLHPRLHKTK